MKKNEGATIKAVRNVRQKEIQKVTEKHEESGEKDRCRNSHCQGCLRLIVPQVGGLD